MTPISLRVIRDATVTHLTMVTALLFCIGPNWRCAAEQPIQRKHGWTQNQFITTFWCPPPGTDEALGRVAREGFNLTWVPREGLDMAQKHHLRAMLTSELLTPAVLEQPAKLAQLEQLVESVRRHPALEAYYITDEPGANDFAGLGKLVAYLRDHDPEHLAYINLFPTYANEQQLGINTDEAVRSLADLPPGATDRRTNDPVALRYREYLRRFVATVKPDLISYDHYHFFKDGKTGAAVDGKEYFLNLGLIRSAALEAGKPFLNIIQADTIEKNWRLPNTSETRWLAFTTLAYGGRGISYFTYWGPAAYNGLYVDGKPAERLPAIVAQNHELAHLGAAMMKLKTVGVYHTAPVPYGAEPLPAEAPVQVRTGGEFVIGLFGMTDRTEAFMIVNRDYRNGSEAVLDLKRDRARVEELDRATGRWSKLAKLGRNEALHVKLSPGDGRLFRWSGH
jgi:hypothetical protein